MPYKDPEKRREAERKRLQDPAKLEAKREADRKSARKRLQDPAKLEAKREAARKRLRDPAKLEAKREADRKADRKRYLIKQGFDPETAALWLGPKVNPGESPELDRLFGDNPELDALEFDAAEALIRARAAPDP